MHDPGGVGLTWMDSSGYHNNLFSKFFLFGVTKISDGKHWYIYTAERGCNLWSLNNFKWIFIYFEILKFILFFLLMELLNNFMLLLLYLLDEISHHAEGIGHGIREVYFIIIMFKRIIPA